jgi:hypothetical protein
MVLLIVLDSAINVPDIYKISGMVFLESGKYSSAITITDHEKGKNMCTTFFYNARRQKMLIEVSSTIH